MGGVSINVPTGEVDLAVPFPGSWNIWAFINGSGGASLLSPPTASSVQPNGWSVTTKPFQNYQVYVPLPPGAFEVSFFLYVIETPYHGYGTESVVFEGSGTYVMAPVTPTPSPEIAAAPACGPCGCPCPK